MLGFARSIARAWIYLVIIAVPQITCKGDDSEQRNGNQPPGERVSAPDAPSKSPMEKTIQDLAAIAKKSVVVVTFTGRDGQRQGLGTGFIISDDGLIATNLHVIGEARPIRVELHDGRKFEVSAVHASDRFWDLAVLKINASNLPALPLGNSDELKEGQTVVAIGHPLGLERSVVAGVLSGRRDIDGRSMLQIAMPIERGNSGGPLLDLQGHVHGLLTLKSLRTENLGFAQSVNSLKPLLEKPNPIPMNRWLTIGIMDPQRWNVSPGSRWRQRAGRITVDGIGEGFGGRTVCLAAEVTPQIPFEVAVQVKFTPSDGAAGLVFHADGGDKHFGFYPTNGNIRLTRFDGPDVYSWAILKEARPSILKKEGWNSLKVRVEPKRMLCYLNNELVFDVNDATYQSGKVGICKFRNTEAEFKGFRCGKLLSEDRISGENLSRISTTIDDVNLDETAVVQRLADENVDMSEILEQQAFALEARATRIRRIAADLHLARTLAELKKVIGADSIDLLRGALLIAKLDNPDLDVDGYIYEVDRHAQRVKESLEENASEEYRLVALNRYLFEEQGFHGSRTDYDNQSNSYLNEVLDDREGLPITLSVLYMEIAKRLDLNVVGVGMPGHFLTRHEPTLGPAQLVDVFDRGRLITAADAQSRFEGLADQRWRDSFLDAITPKAILERILRNLFQGASPARDADRMLGYANAVLIITPDSELFHLYRGVLSHQTQRFPQAQAEIEWLRSHETTIGRSEIDKLERAIERDSRK